MASPPPATEQVVVRVARLASLTPAETRLLTGAVTHADEERVARMPDALVARRTLLARGLLRVLLAERLVIPAERVELIRSPGGKPGLALDQAGCGGLAFNLSHSRDAVVVAITGGRPVGVDLEAVDPRLDVDAIVRRFFPTAEAAALLAAPPGARRTQFFRSWSRKEALLKAEGTGMRRGLHEVLTSPVPFADHPVAVPDASGWWVMDLDVLPGFSCAVVADGPDWLATARPWPDVSPAGPPALSTQSTQQ
jgi:4'-phosphopantetheinyl transferase